MNKTCSTMFFAVLLLNSVLLGTEPSFMGFKAGEWVTIWVKAKKEITGNSIDTEKLNGVIESAASDPYPFIRIITTDGSSSSFKGEEVLKIQSCKPLYIPKVDK